MNQQCVEIRTAAELKNINLQGSYRLACDIDLEGAVWTPLGTEEAPFRGYLDGCGHAVSNFRICGGAGDLGFFGANEGTVYDLTLRNMTLTAELCGPARVGAIAGANYGELGGVRVEGGSVTVTCRDGAALLCGVFAGENQGICRNVRADLPLTVAAGAAEASVGGFFGRCTAGLVEHVEPLGIFTVTGEKVKTALYAVEMANTELIACRFACPMNTVNGQLFSNYAVEEADDVTWDGCLWRDNKNDDRFLPAENYALRKECADFMRLQATHKWAADRTLEFECNCMGKVHHQVFREGVVRTGMNYCHLGNSYEKFLRCFREDGSLQPWIPNDGYDGFDLYMGNDCSTMVAWALSRAVNDFEWRWTQDMMPIHGLGAIACGDYDATCSEYSDEVVNKNGWDVIAEAYASGHIGDTILNFHAKGGGHVRMLMQNAVVFRNREGVIDVRQSYLITTEQGNGLLAGYEHLGSSCLTDYQYPFLKLLKQDYIPLTYKTLQDGVKPETTVTLTERSGINSGILESNCRINSVTASIWDGEKSVWEWEYFASHRTFTQVQGGAAAREIIRKMDLRCLRPYLNGRQLEKGKSYVYKLKVLLANGETVALEDLAFTW